MTDQRIPDAITEAVSAQTWLDPIAEAVQPLVGSALDAAGLHVRNFLHGTVLGHPMHPVLTDIPIGAWTVALALDLADATGVDGARGAADTAVAIGLAGAAASAITGLADWSQTDGKPRRVGVAHAATNIAATLLYATSMALRSSRSRRQAARMTALAGFGVVMAGAFLGGHLVYGEQIGVNHTNPNDADKPKEWTNVGADDVKDKPKKVEADGVPIVLVRHEGHVCALTEVCPHLGGPLSEGKIVDGTIRCPWHGSRFDLESGSAVEGPTAFPARALDVRTKDGGIEVRARVDDQAD